MTQREAWLEAKRYFETSPTVVLGVQPCLCHYLRVLQPIFGRLKRRTYRAMKRAISIEAARNGVPNGEYIWPLNDKGHALRVAFCEKMANRLSRRQERAKGQIAP